MVFRLTLVPQRLWAMALTLVTVVALSPSASLAQQPQLAEQTQPGGLAAQATEPVLVVALGGTSKLTQDLGYLTSAVGKPNEGHMAAMAINTFTAGLDATQPIGVVVPLVGGVPQPLALLPTPDIKKVLDLFKGQTGPYDELDDGTLVINVGANTVFIRQAGNWAVLAQSREVLDLAPADPAAVLGELGDAFDLAFKLRMQEVPPETRDMLISLIRQGYEQAMARQPGADADQAREVAETSIAQLEQVIRDTDELSFVWNIDPAAKQIIVNGVFTAVEGSDMANMYSGQVPIPSRFASVIRDDAAGYYHAATSISPEAVEQTKSSLESSLTMLKGALANDGQLPAESVEEISSLVDRLSKLALDSIAEGKADVGALLLAGQSDLQFVFGSFVADGNEAAQLVKDLATQLEGKPNAPQFMFDQSTYNGVNMHLIEADVPADQDEARKIFGDKLRVHIGTGPKAVYLALGNESAPLLKQLIDDGATDQGGVRPIGQLQLRLLPILEYAQSIEVNDTIAAMIDALVRSPDPGMVRIINQQIPNGQSTELTIGEGLLSAIGAAITQVQQAQQAQLQKGGF